MRKAICDRCGKEAVSEHHVVDGWSELTQWSKFTEVATEAGAPAQVDSEPSAVVRDGMVYAIKTGGLVAAVPKKSHWDFCDECTKAIITLESAPSPKV